MTLNRCIQVIVLTSVLSFSTSIPALQAGEASNNSSQLTLQGGLIVYVDCDIQTWLTSPFRGDSYYVQILDANTNAIQQARQVIDSHGLGTGLCADRFDGRHLPYVDNMVNLLVVGRKGSIPREEIERVVAPGGVALIEGQKWAKSRPTAIDEWTHCLHDPSNNAVADDTVLGPPRRLQWQGGPKWTRHHDRMSSFSAMVSAGGRVFYIFDEGSTASIFLPSHWRLVARDAFNGKVLWKRNIDSWYTRFKGLKDGPADAPRRLVASQDRIYATLSLDGPVTCLDAESGTTLMVYRYTDNAEEILLSGETLFVLTGPGSLGDGGRLVRPVEQRTIKALHSQTGELLWRHRDVVAATTLAVDNEQVYYFNFDTKQANCLDRGTGALQWTSASLPSPPKQTSFFASKLVVQDGVVLFAGGELSGMTKSGGGEKRDDTLTALDADSGKQLWQANHPPSGYSSPENLFVINGIVWCDNSSNGASDGTVIGRDLHSGQIKQQFSQDEKNYWFHHRCYPGRASTKYLMTSRTGTEFVDLNKQHWDLNHWVRGACLYGIMPCNGLVYTPPSPCICYAETYLHSFNAFAPASTTPKPPEPAPENRLQKGPAFDSLATNPQPLASKNDWPTYRCNSARNGYISTNIPTKIKPQWQTKIGGKLSSVTVADGKVFVAAVDRHTIHALSVENGNGLWQFIAGARVDSPPTYYKGSVLFGSADGYVYCLDADTGVLVWRFLAAPMDRRLLAYEQIESLWPIHGSVLVQDGIAHVVAGRSLFVDGGMRYYRLDAESGRLLSQTVLDNRHPQTGQDIQESIKWLNMPPGRPDILSCDGQRIYMRSQAFDLEGNRLNLEIKANGPTLGSYQKDPNKHLFCPTGFLDDTWFHRTYWLYGSTWGSGWCGYYIAGKFAPAGKIMSVGTDHVYCFGRLPEYYKWTTPMEYRLFAARKAWTVSPDQSPPNDKAKKKKRNNKMQVPGPFPMDNSENYAWSRSIPILVRALTATENALFVAGPRDVLPEGNINNIDESLIRQQEAAFQGKIGALLWTIDTEDGKTLAEYELPSPPIFDGMAAAQQRLFISMIDGTVACWGDRRQNIAAMKF